MESKVFDVEAAGLTLQFEFYTFDSIQEDLKKIFGCLLYTSPSPRDYAASRMPSSA